MTDTLTSTDRGMLDDVPGRILSPDFVGRAAELELLAARLTEARHGEPSVVLIGGEAGVGKTRLIEEFTAAAQDLAEAEDPQSADAVAPATVLIGGCFDLGDDALPFAPFSAALREPMRAAGVSELVELAGGGSADRRRLYEAVSDLIERHGADQPLVLVLEDLHWADRSTRELLSFLARTLHGTSALIVGTFRSDELHRSHPLRPFLAELERVRIVERLELPRLNRAQVGEQLAGLLERAPTPEELDAVYRRSEGNPFFVEELTACQSVAALPSSLRDLLLVRVERLQPATQHVLRNAAIIGVTVPHQLLAAVLREDDDALTAALREAVDSNLLVTRSDDGSYVFRHSLLREAVHDDLLPGEHTELHRLVARTLAENSALLPGDRWAMEVAHHWNAAHDQPRALASAHEAAKWAERTHAYAEQLRMLERVLALWEVVPDAHELIDADELTVTMLASKTAGSAGQSERALSLANRAVELAAAGDDVERHVLALIQRGKRCSDLRRENGRQDLRDALALLPVDPPTPLRAHTLEALSSLLMLEGVDEEATQLAEEALAAARATQATSVEISALTTLATLSVGDDGHDGVALAREALALVEGTDNDLGLARVLTNLSHIYTGLGQHEDAIDAATRGLNVIGQIGMSRTFGPVLAANIADSMLWLGRLDEAEAVIDDAAAISQSANSSWAYLFQLRGWLAVQRGDIEGAERTLDQMDAQFNVNQLLPQDRLPVNRLRAQIELAKGDPVTAYEFAATGSARETSGCHARYLWPLAVVAAEATADYAQRSRDRRDDVGLTSAMRQVEEVAGLADSLVVAGSAGQAWRTHVDAELARAQDLPESRGADGVLLWRGVAHAYAKLSEPWQRVRALARAAECAATAKDGQSAQTLLREADEIAAAHGLLALRQQVSEFARRARIELITPGDAGDAGNVGAPPHTAAHPEIVRLGLTEREQDVLREVAAGRTNRQIAEVLFMSPKTASVHVSNILTKLDVRSRGEAAAVAHRLRLFPSEPSGSQ